MMRRTREAAQAQRIQPVEVSRRRHPLLFIVGIIAFLMFLYGGFLAQQLLDPTAFPIRKIAVDGEFHHLTAEHMQTVVSKAVHGGFFDVDVGKVRAHILDEPWVFEASVRRVWPDTIRVSIREQVAVARWGEYGLLNKFADIFVPDSDEIPPNLAMLDGPIGTEAELLARFFTVRKFLDSVGLTAERVGLSDRRAWIVDIKNGATLVIGRHAIVQRLGRFSRAFEHVLKDSWTRVALVDLRYTNGFAIREKVGAVNNG